MQRTFIAQRTFFCGFGQGHMWGRMVTPRRPVRQFQRSVPNFFFAANTNRPNPGQAPGAIGAPGPGRGAGRGRICGARGVRRLRGHHGAVRGGPLHHPGVATGGLLSCSFSPGMLVSLFDLRTFINGRADTFWVILGDFGSKNFPGVLR